MAARLFPGACPATSQKAVGLFLLGLATHYLGCLLVTDPKERSMGSILTTGGTGHESSERLTLALPASVPGTQFPAHLTRFCPISWLEDGRKQPHSFGSLSTETFPLAIDG